MRGGRRVPSALVELFQQRFDDGAVQLGAASGHIVERVRIAIVDPSAYTPPYDHALCSALAAAGAKVELLTSRFAYGPVPSPDGYKRREVFYRLSHRSSASGPRSKLALALKLAEHVPDMLRCGRIVKDSDVVHFQWLTVQQLDRLLLPSVRPLVLTSHDVMPREPRPGQLHAQRRLYDRFDAIVVHSEEGKRRLVEELGVDEERVSVIPHGIFDHLSPPRDARETMAGAPRSNEGAPPRPNGPVILFFGLLRRYKGIDLLLSAWRMLSAEERRGGQLWIAGMPRMDLAELGLEDDALAARDGVRLTPRFIGDEEIPSWFESADLVVLPYRQADQSGVLFTALAFGRPLLLSDVGGFGEIAKTGAARLVPAGDAKALAAQLRDLLASPDALTEMAAAAQALRAPESPLSWQSVAREHLRLYERLLG